MPVSKVVVAAWAQVSAGDSHTCGVSVNGDAACWGRGVSGQLGSGDTLSKYTPSLVKTTIKWAMIAAGGTFSCGLSTAGKLYCMGGRDDATAHWLTGANIKRYMGYPPATWPSIDDLVPVPDNTANFYSHISLNGKSVAGIVVPPPPPAPPPPLPPARTDGYSWGE